ncbi:IclR family transcriptional regulator [Streptomyces sp. Li-HN-5-11]|uniref:IclR family transcriptional regulator n=1 Tax=Streptomyces sp. Li-HN-5-11 TaxID=3075432 RepID=UPI0028B1F598|nr:IclR family transcriptional regulator [Streptomyces sp. Li-HN-5-11]WNM34765.1 IclR family transcriptional regulator [Streptomyces sp. Li-HN-5-11]
MSSVVSVSSDAASPNRRPRRSTERSGSADTSAAKVLVLLDAFRGPKGVLGVTELAQAVGVPKSTAHRLLAIMVESGFVRKVGSRYCLTERLFEVGNRVGSPAIRSTGLRRRAMPYLTDLHAGSRDTVHLATLSGTDVLYLEKLFGHDAGCASTAVGIRRPAHATALGKAMLAYAPDAQAALLQGRPMQRFTAHTLHTEAQLEQELRRIRDDGLAYDDGELQEGLQCIAVPILDASTGAAVAAVSVSSLRSRTLTRYASRLLALAHDLSRAAA